MLCAVSLSLSHRLMGKTTTRTSTGHNDFFAENENSFSSSSFFEIDHFFVYCAHRHHTLYINEDEQQEEEAEAGNRLNVYAMGIFQE